MEIKQNKGITLVMLVITVVILIILATVSINIGTSMIKKVNVENIRTNMLLIQAQVKTIHEKHHFDEENNPLKGEEVTLTEDDIAKYQVETQSEDGQTEYQFYKLSVDDLNSMNLNSIKINEGDEYIVNYDTQEIIYTKGVEGEEGKIYYTLTQMNK